MQHRDYVESAKRKRLMEKSSSSSSDVNNRCNRDDESSSSSMKNKNDPYLAPIPEAILSRDPLLINIGALRRTADWVSVNSQMSSQFGLSDQIDVVRRMHNLYGFPNESVSVIYSSHTLEHGSFGDGELEDTLKEWRRVLNPAGLLLLSVPDLPTLSQMYLDPTLSFSQHWMITKMMYGAQMDAADYHKIGFDLDTLTYFLSQAGFCQVERVKSFNLPFQDTSDMVYAGYFISLNVAAR